mmetsp:Transcript_72207/g.233633  ORF Transcript_72207/g.233633 Transcript_72207/m.233633 type:complete len:377 (-) Transcript_72207:871-2001(-)
MLQSPAPRPAKGRGSLAVALAVALAAVALAAVARLLAAVALAPDGRGRAAVAPGLAAVAALAAPAAAEPRGLLLRAPRGVVALAGAALGLAAHAGARVLPRSLLHALLRRRLRLGELELHGLVAGVDAALALAAVLLRHLDKAGGRSILRKLSHQEGVFLCDAEGVLDEIRKVSELLHAEQLHIEGLLEVLGVVKAQVGLTEARAVRVIQILLEGLNKEVQLVAGAQKRPILVDKVGEKRLAVPEVGHVLHGSDIDILCVDVHGLGILGCLLAALGLLLVLLLLGEQRLPLGRILPVVLPLAPLLQCFLPLRQLLLEPGAWLQVFGALRELLLKHPGLQELGARSLSLPAVGDCVKALLAGGHGEARVGLGERPLA